MRVKRGGGGNGKKKFMWGGGRGGITLQTMISFGKMRLQTQNVFII